MIIKKLTASFGKLNNDSISFHDGLNVISLPNESGKSTWCAFIKAMFFGVDSSDRVKNGYLPDKQKYAPWSGAPMEGTMELRCDSKDITISRTTRLANAPMREFSATYSGTADTVDELSGTNSGEMLTGVSKEVFLRSAFIEQGSSAITGSAELEKRIASLCSSGEEDVSFSETAERLRSWQRKRKYNSHGFIPETEDEIQKKTVDIKTIEKSLDAINTLETENRNIQRDIQSLEEDVTRARREQRENLLAQIGQAREEVKKTSIIQNNALNELNIAKKALRTSRLGVIKDSEVRLQAGKDIEAVNELSAVAVKSTSLFLSVLFILIAIASAVVYQRLFVNVILVICAGVFCIASIVLLSLYLKRRRAMTDADRKKAAILNRYAAKDTNDIEEAVHAHERMCKDIYDASSAYKEASLKYDEADEKLTELEKKIISEEEESDASVLSKKLAELRTAQSLNSMKIAEENGKLMTLGDPLVIKSSITNLKNRKDKLEKEYDAINLAIDTLKSANDEIQLRFSPVLSRKAAEYMSKMTGGKYDQIYLNKDFSARTKTKDDAVARESEYLSAGTSDLLYLAVRLAICDIALPQGENCPLIIDDALVNLDEERYNQAIKLLLEIAKERQVILFTCRK